LSSAVCQNQASGVRFAPDSVGDTCPFLNALLTLHLIHTAVALGEKIPMSENVKHRRLALILFVCWGLVIGIAMSATAQSTRVWLDPAKLDLAPGDVGELNIRVENVSQLAGAEVHLTFNPMLLEVADKDPSTAGIQIAHGDFLSPDFVAQNITALDNGTIDYAIACIPVDKAASGSGALAHISFRALSEGEALVAIRSVLLADPQGRPIETGADSSLVAIGRSGPPPTVWVLIGLVAVTVAVGLIVVVWSAIKAR
jgi:hypothetical protein